MFGKYLKGKAKPSGLVIQKLCLYLDADANELLGVDGSYVGVPMYATTAKLGEPQLVQGEDAESELHFRKDWLKKKTTDTKRLGVLGVEGRSMEHKGLRTGDVVLFNRAAKDPDPGKLYVFRIDNGLTVKELKLEDNGELVIWGKDDDGENFRSYGTLNKDAEGRLAIIGRVLWRGGNVK